MSTDQRPLQPVTVSVPAQRQSPDDVLRAGREGAPPASGPVPPEPAQRRRRTAVGAAALLGLGGAVLLGPPPWGEAPAAPAAPEPVALALVTPAPTATARPHGADPAFVTLRLRVAVRNDGREWVALTGASLGPYRAAGDGLGTLAPGALASVPLERLVVCDSPALGPAPRSLELDVLGAQGPASVSLALAAPAASDPATAVPDCT